MAESEEGLFEEDGKDHFAQIAALCVANYIEMRALQYYLAEKGIAIDADRMADLRREIKLGGAGLRDRGYGQLASLVRFAQDFEDDLDEASDRHD